MRLATCEAARVERFVVLIGADALRSYEIRRSTTADEGADPHRVKARA